MAFYVVVLELSTTVTVVILLACAVLVFVPIKYVYPSRTDAFWMLNLSLAGLWLVLYGVILATFPDPNMFFVGLSLAYVAYYVAVSVYLTMISPRRRARQPSASPRSTDLDPTVSPGQHVAHRARGRESQPSRSPGSPSPRSVVSITRASRFLRAKLGLNGRATTEATRRTARGRCAASRSCRPRPAPPWPAPPRTSARHRSRGPRRARPDRSRRERRAPPRRPPRRMPAAFPTAEDERSAGPAGGVPEHLLPGLDVRPRPDDAPGHAAGPELLLGCELGPEQVSRRVRGRSDDRHQDHRCPGRSRCRDKVGVACLVDLVRPLAATAEEPVEGGDHGAGARRASASPSGRRTSTSTICGLSPRTSSARARSRVSTRTSSPCAISAATTAAAEQPAAPGHDDHPGHPWPARRFSISRVGIDSSAGSSKPSTWE